MDKTMDIRDRNVLSGDVETETRGEIMDGIRLFPRVRPQKMFRILRNRFQAAWVRPLYSFSDPLQI